MKDRTGNVLTEIDKAMELLLAEVNVLDEVEVDLSDASGRILAEEITADRDLPPTDRSGMDGFAVRSADVAEPGTTLRISGEVSAGSPVGGASVEPGNAVRIMTGGTVPTGSDAVVMVELTKEDREKGTVTVLQPPQAGQHVRAQGEDVRAGETILRRGAPIHVPEIAALASVGRTSVRVHRAPVVHVLATGDEVIEVERTPEPHQVRNSNVRTLLAQLADLGVEGRYAGIAPDNLADLGRLIERGLSGDVLLMTGGVSVGDYDLVAEALERAGVKQIFHKVAMKPGKPIIAGRRGRCLVIGLPGNPVSAFTGFIVFVLPALRKMLGYARYDNLEVPCILAERLKRKPGRTTYHLARVSFENGKFVGLPVRTMGSGDVISMSRANAFLITPGSAHSLDAGTEVPAVLWRDFHLR